MRNWMGGFAAFLFLCAGSSLGFANDQDGDSLKASPLRIGRSVGSGTTKSIPIYTNARSYVFIRHSEFKRNERDARGSRLKTVDVIPAKARVSFTSIRRRGLRPLFVRPVGRMAWFVVPRRGGFMVNLNLRPGTWGPEHDAGKYKAVATVMVSIKPFEASRSIID